MPQLSSMSSVSSAGDMPFENGGLYSSKVSPAVAVHKSPAASNAGNAPLRCGMVNCTVAVLLDVNGAGKGPTKPLRLSVATKLAFAATPYAAGPGAAACAAGVDALVTGKVYFSSIPARVSSTYSVP